MHDTFLPTARHGFVCKGGSSKHRATSGGEGGGEEERGDCSHEKTTWAKDASRDPPPECCQGAQGLGVLGNNRLVAQLQCQQRLLSLTQPVLTAFFALHSHSLGAGHVRELQWGWCTRGGRERVG